MLVPRRAVLAGAALLGCADRAAARTPLFVTPRGEGNGASWASAAPLADLGALTALIEPGGEILVAADRGEYAALDVIEFGRTQRKGWAQVRGVHSETGAPMPAVVRGTRGEGETGSEVFRLLDGANQLHFSHFDFRAVGNGCFRVGGRVTGLRIEDCAFDDVYRFLENTAHERGDATLRDFVVRRCNGQRVERGFARIRYASRNGVLEDCTAEGLATESRRDLPVGCALDDNARDIVYRRCTMEGFQQWRTGDYWNGDGFSDESGNSNIRYEECTARGSTDGGFDCKSREVVLSACVAEDNKRNFRIWSARATLRGCVSRNPNFRGRDVENTSSCHIWIGEDAGRVRLEGLVVEDSDATAILEFDRNDGAAEMRGVTVRAANPNWGNVDLRTDGAVTIAEAR